MDDDNYYSSIIDDLNRQAEIDREVEEYKKELLTSIGVMLKNRIIQKSRDPNKSDYYEGQINILESLSNHILRS